MALQEKHFLAPPAGRGHFPPEYFPGAEDKGAAATRQRIQDGNQLAAALPAGAVRDSAVEHYVNWKTGYGLYVTLLTTPANVSAPSGDVTATWTQDQRDKLLAYWEGEKAAWEEEIAPIVELVVHADPFPFGSVPKDITWE
jgi:hypothetical protein